jgi:ABC-type uncharacterized transport system auxiliary subunit
MSTSGKKTQWAAHALITVALMGYLATSGCLTSPNIEITRHYTLQPIVQTETVQKVDFTLGIRPFFAARPFGLEMAFLDDAHQLGYRSKDHWAEPPANTITRAVSDAIADSHRFSDVGNAADMARPDILLTGEVRIFYENRTVAPPQAEVEVRFEMRLARQPGALWAKTLQETEPLDSEDPQSFAQAMNRAVERLAQRAAQEIVSTPMPEELSVKKTNDGTIMPGNMTP